MLRLITCVHILLYVTVVQCGDEFCSKEGNCPADIDTNLIVAAFDFGTTYSGYAFSFRDGTPRGARFSQDSTLGYHAQAKTATCVLLTPQKEFHSFGFEAEKNYLYLTDEDKHHGWLFFRRFKMLLHNNEDLTKKTTIKDVNGVTMPAMTIFTMSIRYMKDHLLSRLEKEEPWIKENDIRYVLTVPAIWNDNAKQFMREAAVQAGIKSSHLKLALEPEAASIWCQDTTDEARTMLHKAGTQYMVIDLGGGTGDISVHEKQINKKLKEIHKPSGGSFGGTLIDNSFLQWFDKIFGINNMEKFKGEDMESYLNLLRDFEIKKRDIRPDVNRKITFGNVYRLLQLYKQNENMPLKDKAASLGLGRKLHFSPSLPDKFRVDDSVIKDWFNMPVTRMISHVEAILDKPHLKNVKTILLVGGFSESEMVYEAMENQFSKTHKIIRPSEASLSVLYGAVRFGHIPNIIQDRIMVSTYGVEVMNYFDERKHPASKMIIRNNKKMIYNIFHIFVRKDDSVELGKEIHKNGFIPTDLQQTFIPIYKSTEHDPVFVTDEGCSELGSLTIDHPEGNTFEDKKFSVTFVFGDTELYVKVKMEKTGHEFTKYVNCLDK